MLWRFNLLSFARFWALPWPGAGGARQAMASKVALVATPSINGNDMERHNIVFPWWGGETILLAGWSSMIPLRITYQWQESPRLHLVVVPIDDVP